MTDWDTFTTCVATKEETFAEALRTEARKTFDDNKPAAMDAMKAVVAWWSKLDGTVKAALIFAASTLSKDAWKKLSAGIVSAAGARVAVLLAAIAAGFAFGSVLAASADCLDEI